jgi:hypothetical protein
MYLILCVRDRECKTERARVAFERMCMHGETERVLLER